MGERRDGSAHIMASGTEQIHRRFVSSRNYNVGKLPAPQAQALQPCIPPSPLPSGVS